MLQGQAPGITESGDEPGNGKKGEKHNILSLECSAFLFLSSLKNVYLFSAKL